MPININSGLQVLDNTPVDNRISVADIAALTNFASNNVYEGLTVYVQSTNQVYVLTDTAGRTISPGTIGSGWTRISQLSTINGEETYGTNVVISLVGVTVGLSSSIEPYDNTNLGDNYQQFPALSGSFPFYKNADQSTPSMPLQTGSIWIVAGETLTARTGSNGLMFLFASSSTLTGRWVPVSPLPSTVVTSYLNNYFNENIVPLSDSASAVKVISEDSSTAYPVTFITPAALDVYSTLHGNADFTYTPSTNLLNATSSWAKNANTASAIQTSNNTIINGDSIVYVNNDGDLVTNIEGSVTNVDSSIKYFTDTATVVADTPAAGTLSGSLKELQIIDYDGNVSTTWNATTGRLTIYFGSPAAPSGLTLNTNNSVGSESWETNRFNDVLDTYDLRASWSNGTYTFQSASIWQLQSGVYVKLAETTTADSTTLVLTTQNDSPYATEENSYPNSSLGSPISTQNFRLHVTASNPVDGTISKQSFNLTKTLNKTLPGTPTQTAVYTSDNSITSYLTTGYSRTIEYGDTGTISHGATVGSDNAWNPIPSVGTNITLKPDSPVGTVTVNATSNYTLQCTASYNTNGNNTPEIIYEAKDTNIVYTRQRSVRIGVVPMSDTYAVTSSITNAVLTDVGGWISTYMESGTVYSNSTPDPNGKNISVTFNYDDTPGYGRRVYIVVDSQYTLDGITTTGQAFDNLPTFNSMVVGGWRVYYTNASNGLGTTNPNTNTFNYTLST